MENVIEVRYAGVVVGRSTKVRDWGEAGAFIGFAEPLPTGTPLVLKGDGIEQPARVVQVIESADPAVAGMQVTFVDAARAVRPSQRSAAAPAKAAAAPSAAPAPAAPATASAPAPVAPPPAVVAEAASASPPAVAEAAPVAEAAVVAEAAPVEIAGGASSALPSEVSGPATADHAEGDAGQGGGGGKRRRRRR